MVDAGIGRLLVASLHDGITDVVPARLPFYEYWLTSSGLRNGRVSLAALHAVLSFLRLEGQAVYDGIMKSAGGRAAEWVYADWSPVERAVLRRLPRPLKVRWVLAACRRLVTRTFRASGARVRTADGTATLEIRTSVFCAMRQATDWPTCGYYAAAIDRLMSLCGIDAEVSVGECRASGVERCAILVALRGRREVSTTEEAA
ncbi:MAG: hypothetical protein ACT4QD_11345 [Acidobacteriota bacterium]